MTPVVSVVIPTYNRAHDLRRALASVVAQTFSDWEALVVDNHSTDETASVVNGFGDARIRQIMVHNHGVIAVSRNLGVREARGEYVAFLDSDDWWVPEKLERSVAELRAGADIVYHDLRIVRPGRKWWHSRMATTRALSSPVYDDLTENGNALVNSAVVVKRELLQRLGGLSEEKDLIAWEDYDCWLRLARVTERFVRLPEPLGYYWIGGSNVSSPQWTARNLGFFRDRHLVPSGRTRDDQVPAWHHYSMGRAYYRLGQTERARHHMHFALHGRLPPYVRLKALVTLAGSMLHGSRAPAHKEAP